MPKGYEDPREALVRAALRLQRVSNAIASDRGAILEEMFDEVAGLIAKIDPTGPPQAAYRRLRADKLMAEVERVTGEAFGTYHQGVRDDLARLGRAHGQQVTADLVATLGPMGSAVRAAAPTQNMVKAILDANPFEGETLRGWAGKGGVQHTATVRRIRQEIQKGMMDEESIDYIVRQVRGGRGVKGVWQTTRREAEAVVRTGVTFVAAESQHATYSANRKVTKTYTFVATLDSRTSEECMAADGRVFGYDEDGRLQPPLHFQCRSSIAPNPDWEGLGLDPPEEGMRAARDPETGKRTEVPASQTYGDWLKDQPPGVQDDILGPGRGKLFRDGEIGVRDLVKKDGGRMTLDELEADG